MAWTDEGMDLGDLSEAVLNAQRLHPAPMQFHRHGQTTKWFKPRQQPWVGKQWFYRVFTKPLTGVRRETFDTGAIGEFPAATTIEYDELSVVRNDLKMFRATKQYNEKEHEMTANTRMAVGSLALKLTTQVEDDFAGQLNAGVNQPGTAMAAKVKQIYDADGTTFSGASGHVAAYISISGGSISQFHSGEILDIYDTDGSTKNATVVVHDVIYGADGPPAAGSRVATIGPGLIIEPCDAYGAVEATAWNAVAAPAVGDYLARSGEFTSTVANYRNFHGFPDWFDTTVDVFRDHDGTAIDREGTGAQWMNPQVVEAGTSGTPLAFDMELHFGEIEDTLPYRVETGRRQRMNSEQGLGMLGSLVAIAEPKIVNDAVREASASRQFTIQTAKSMEAADRRELFGEVGFNGIVYHSPSMGQIALQADAMAEPETINIIDPNSFFFIYWGKRKGQVNWLKMDSNGSIWRRKSGVTVGRPTYYLEGAADAICCLQCDQPGVNTRIRYVKSSR